MKITKHNYKYYSKLMQNRALRLKRNATAAEKVMLEALEENNIPFKFQSHRFKNGQLRIFDFWIPYPYRIDLEIDGGYHNKTKDRFKDKKLIEARPLYKILRFSNNEILNNPMIAIEAILRSTPKGATRRAQY